MRLIDNGLRLSATDVANHLGCRHLTSLDLEAAHGRLRPPIWRDPNLDVLQQRGLEHERAYLDHLRRRGMEIHELPDAEASSALEATLAAMRAGAGAIVQATLTRPRWFGRADVLLRVDTPSALGAWSYEVIDTKLARETRAGTILQLSLYSDILGELQGLPPYRMHVVAPGRGFEPESFRVEEYAAYYRFLKRRLEEAVDPARHAGTYPDPTAQCEICRWWSMCDGRRRSDDHLGFVAGITTLQRRELQSLGITTLAGLAAMSVPLERKPRRGARESYERAREQARLQLERRTTGTPVFELLPVEPDAGLARVPEPSEGDLFFDIEGDPFVGEGGLEYLFGLVTIEDGQPAYMHRWSRKPTDERAAFEWLVDTIMARWERHRDLHVYHFAPYEPSALRRLMGRHGVRETEVDTMLRAGLFVDLHAVVRRALRASVEHYSIKELEPFYGFARQVPLQDARKALRAVERCMELGSPLDVRADFSSSVRDYNRDDCVSAMRLRDWLEELRAKVVAAGASISRPAVQTGEASEKVEARQSEVDEVKAALLRKVPSDPASRTPAQQATWILAELLEWYRRESKAPWWEYFRLRDLTDEELIEERRAISGLTFVERVGGTAKCPIDRYSYPKQEADIRTEDKLRMTNEEDLGVVARHDTVARLLDVKKSGATADVHPTSVFAHEVVRTTEQTGSLLRIGRWVAERGIDAPGPCRAGRDLLMRHPPRLASGAVIDHRGEETQDVAERLVLELEGGVLAVQGPPGAGKTHTGARMICALLRARKRVGITAVSHKVIENLIDAVVARAKSERLIVRCIQKVGEKTRKNDPIIVQTKDNAKVAEELAARRANVGAGTAWLWSREELGEAVDVLFVDEAGQMSLTDVVAVSQAARNVVLLGDPQQLEQPQQGSHPEGTSVSALEHLLGEARTMPATMGLFLPKTWRLHPEICRFTSEGFYEGRLSSRPGLERQVLQHAGRFEGAGLRYIPVVHEGNQSSSPEEVERVAAIVAALTRDGVTWVDANGRCNPLRLADILIVAPYNAHVALIGERVPGARVGTVDRFQGQEAPVVIYTMATSAPEDAPRGMEFLYSLHRLNVATSRARCLVILVASPRLLHPECRTPRQVQLANAFCRFLELAGDHGSRSALHAAQGIPTGIPRVNYAP